jgi:DNA-binding CsgD family transcriptional regulator
MATRLSARDFEAARRVLREIGGGCPTPGEFARRGVRLLPGLVASEITTLSLCDLVTGRRRVVSEPVQAFAADDLAAFDRHFRSHPLVRFHATHRDGGPRRISDSLSRREFRASALYADYYAKVGLDHALALPLHVDARLLVSFVFNRKHRDFSDRERELLDLVRPHLGSLYRQSYRLEQAQRALAASGDPTPLTTSDGVDSLTPREREVLAWVAAGKSNAQIAAILGTMPRTVAKHLERVVEKLGVVSRTAAAMRALAARPATTRIERRDTAP